MPKVKDKTDKAKNLFDGNNQSDEEAKEFVLDSVAKFCDRCGEGFKRENINIVKRAPGQVLFHIQCEKCGSSHLASFVSQLGVSSRTPFQTDLSLDELKLFASFDALSSNEVLDVYDYVNANKNLPAEKLLELLKKAETASATKG